MYFVIYGRFLWLWPQEMWDVHNQLNDQQMCNYDTKNGLWRNICGKHLKNIDCGITSTCNVMIIAHQSERLTIPVSKIRI